MRQQAAPLLSAREATAELRHGAEVRAQEAQPGLAAVHHLRAPLLFGALILYVSSASLGSTSKRSRGSTYSSGSWESPRQDFGSKFGRHRRVRAQKRRVSSCSIPSCRTVSSPKMSWWTKKTRPKPTVPLFFFLLEIKHMILKDPGENRAFTTFLGPDHHKRGSKELKEG